VKWRDMNETVLGKHKATTSERPEPSHLSPSALGDKPSENNQLDGLEELDQPAPDLHGIEGAIFSPAKFINIRSPMLLDVLSDKPQLTQPYEKEKEKPSNANDKTANPKENEWREW